MNKSIAQLLHQYCTNLAKKAGTQSATELFNITPPIETALRKAMLESVEFLKLINVSAVNQIKGQVVDAGAGTLFTGRKQGGRFVKEIGVSGNTYELIETDSCASVSWEMLSQWADGNQAEFMKMMNSVISEHFALDMLRVGFHGTSIALTTDPIANPNGEDVNKGWLAIVKEKAKEQVIPKLTLDPTGAAADSYRNLDALAVDLRNSLIAEQHVEAPDLVVLVGRNLVAGEQYRLLNSADKPTERKEAQKLSKTIGGMLAIVPPSFKPDQLWVTSLKNLQILQQKGTQWRKARNEEDRKAFENSWLRNEGYAVGNFEKFAAVESVTVAGANTASFTLSENHPETEQE